MHALAAPDATSDRALTATVVAAPQHLRRSMYITSSAIPGSHSVLNDTGAQFSAVSKRHVDANHLHVHRPKADEVKYLSLADKSMTVPRLGYVNIPVIIHFRGGTPRAPYRCTKQFEVLNMDYDFILGVDLLPMIFPRDEILDHLILPSRITTPPQPLLGTIVCDMDNEAPRSAVSQFNDPHTLRYTEVPPGAAVSALSSDTVNEYINDRLSESFQHLLGFGDDGSVVETDSLDTGSGMDKTLSVTITNEHVSDGMIVASVQDMAEPRAS
jgi:hypothetical protein